MPRDETVHIEAAEVSVVGRAIGTSTAFAISGTLPVITLKSVLQFGEKTAEGVLVRGVALPWFEILKIIENDPEAVYRIPSRKWEEIIAGSYERAGYRVILTPASGDGGKDIIATKEGLGSIRIFEEVKAYKPGHLVKAKEVRSLMGVIAADHNVSKGIITTTSDFAPRVRTDPSIASYLPHRLELRPRDSLLAWLAEVLASQGAK